MDQLAELIDSIIATDDHPTSWDYWLDDADGPYIDCSQVDDGTYRWETGDGRANTQLDLTVDQLREIHRRLTIQLAIVARQRQH